MESSLRFVNSSFYRKNQVFENACELHRTRYVMAFLITCMQMIRKFTSLSSQMIWSLPGVQCIVDVCYEKSLRDSCEDSRIC